MPLVPFSTIVENVGVYKPLPDGEYRVKVGKIEVKQTNAGDEMWSLHLVVTDGEYKDRLIFDNITFSPNGYGRVKLVCKRLGVQTDKDMVLIPNMLENREAFVTVITSDYVAKDGTQKTKNSVPFAGYREVGNTGEVTDNDLPF